jgi:hypothetical protein
LLFTAGPASPETASASAGKSAIVTPHQGQRVQDYPVRVVVRAGDRLFDLKASLNGQEIDGDFGQTHKGSRTAVISRSQGLDRGKNVLKVKARRDIGEPRTRSRIRFFVDRKAPLAGAGRDRRVVEDAPVDLRGRALGSPSSSLPGAGEPKIRYRWQLKNAPKLSRYRDGAQTRDDGPDGAALSDPTAPSPRFRPDVPGRYRFKLRVKQGSRSTSDTVKLSVLPGKPLVPIDTMATDSDGTPAIKVDGHPYRAEPGTQQNPAWFQVLVLDRSTLGKVSNQTYLCDRASNTFCIDNREQCGALGDLGCLQHDLAQLGKDDTKLVIAVNHGLPSWSPPGYLPFTKIGVKNYRAEDLPGTGVGSFSAIGVPGLPAGQADARVVVGGASGSGRMTGYLTPDVYFNYAWLPPESPAFDTRSAGQCVDDRVRLCFNTMTVGGHDFRSASSQSGYQVEVFNGHTLDHVGSGTFQTLGGNPELDRMHDFVAGTPPGNLVLITGIDDGEFQPLGGSDHGAINRLADAVASVGGTKNLFLRSGATKSSFYTLVGWAGAGEGNGEETSRVNAGPTGLGRLRGTLTRDHEQLFRPITASVADQPPEALTRVMLQPASPWPLDGDPAAQKAIAYIGSQVKKLGEDPRSAYWTQALDQAGWISVGQDVGNKNTLNYPGDNRANCNNGGFCLPDFQAARRELLKEIHLVGNVRGYLADLSSPFAEDAISTWSDLQVIADASMNSLHPPPDQILSNVVLVSGIVASAMQVAAVPGGEEGLAMEQAAQMLSLTNTYLSDDRDGSDADIVRTAADKLAANLIQRLKTVQASYFSVGSIIVGDYDKLQTVGTLGGCKAGPSCPPEWQYTTTDKQASSMAIWKASESSFDQQFVRIAFPSWLLGPRQNRARDPRQEYSCGLTSLKVFQDEPSDGFVADYAQYPDSYDIYALANLSNIDLTHRIPGTPPATTTTRMFGPLGASLDPKKGGLGIYAPDFFREANKGIGEFSRAHRTDGGGYPDTCSWDR